MSHSFCVFCPFLALPPCKGSCLSFLPSFIQQIVIEKTLLCTGHPVRHLTFTVDSMTISEHLVGARH